MKRFFLAMAAMLLPVMAHAQVPPSRWTQNYIPTLADWRNALLYNGQTLPDALGLKVDNSDGKAANLALTGGTELLTPNAGDNGTAIPNTFYVDRADSLKVDITNGKAENLSISGGSQLITPNAGDDSTTIPNTIYVDRADNLKVDKENGAAEIGFLSNGLTLAVCPSGCAYSSVHDAFGAALKMVHMLIVPNATVTVSIADGTYTEAAAITTNDPLGKYIQVMGASGDQTKVTLNFTTVTNNGDGFSVTEGGNIGLIDGVTVHAVNAITSQTTTAIHWDSSSRGHGIYARGGSITLGAHVTVDGFYYGINADHGGEIFASYDKVTNAGDVAIFAKFGGVLTCMGCTANTVGDSDYSLGCGFMSEQGGHLDVPGATAGNTLLGGVCSISGGSVWADSFTGTGGLGAKVGTGIWTLNGGTVQAEHATLSGYLNGVWAQYGSSMDILYANITGTAGSGIEGDAGSIYGGNVTISGSGTYAIVASHGANIQLWNSLSLITAGTSGLIAQDSTTTTNGATTLGSSVLLN